MATSPHLPTHATRARTRIPGLRWAALAVVVVAAAAGAVGASAAPAPGVAAAAPSGVGTLPPLPPPPAQNQAAIVAGAARAAVAQVSFPLPVQVQRVYASYNVEFGENTLITDSAAYVLQAPGPDPVFGVFPDARVTVMGFGAIPVAATIHLTQVSDATGTLEAIKIHNISISDANGATSGTTLVTGKVLIRLSDLTVDQVPLDVGDHCEGSQPIDLVLNGTDAPGGKPQPTDYAPFPGGPLNGTFAIPSFTGCGTATQDLDPLITGTVSGPGNVIALHQGPLGEWDPTRSNDCRISGTNKACATPSPPALPPGD